MVEAGAKEVTDAAMLKACEFAHNANQVNQQITG